MSEPTSESTPKPIAMKISLWEREDDLVTLGCLAPEDLNTRDWKLGDEIVLKVIGLEHKGWDGTEVR